jgi:hypothetical protein
METRDYLMRQFNQLGKVLGKLLADLFEPDNNASASQTIENNKSGIDNYFRY